MANQPTQFFVWAIILAARANLITLYSPVTGTLQRVDFVIPATGTANAGGPATFDVNVNGVTVFADPGDRPTILASTRTASVQDINTAVNFADPVVIDADVIPAGGIGGPLMISLTFVEPSGSIAQTLPVPDFVRDAHLGALNRVPDAGELSTYTSALNSGCIAGISFYTEAQDMLTDIFTGAEFLALTITNTDYVTRLYRAYFNRDPDTEGLTYWVAQVGSTSRAAVRTAFHIHTELRNRLPLYCRNVLPWASAVALYEKTIPALPGTKKALFYDPATGGGSLVWDVASGTTTLGGDVTGDSAANTVVKLQNRPIKALPSSGPLTDNFNDNILDTTIWVGPGIEQNARLELTSSAVFLNTVSRLNFTNHYASFRWLLGDVKLRLFHNAANGVWMDIYVAWAALSRIRLTRHDSGDTHTDWFPANTGEFAFLRMRHVSADAKWYLDSSTDGINWTLNRANSVLPTGGSASDCLLQFLWVAGAPAAVDTLETDAPLGDVLSDGDVLGWNVALGQMVETPLHQIKTVTAAPTGFPGGMMNGFTFAFFNTTDNKIYVWNPVSQLFKSTVALT